MKWLRFSPLVLSLLAACDKTVPFENTSPIKMTPQTVPNMDAGSFVLLDAQIGPSDGAMAPEIAPEAFTKPELLRQIADCSLSRFREFNGLAAALQVATSAWAANPTDELRSEAQVAWRAAMNSWQQAELFSFGPSGPATTSDQNDPGGKDYRNGIYFFPNINLCLVDQTLLSSGYTKAPLNLNVSAKGLGALEYLLFYDGATNACSSGIAINTGSPSPWQKLDPTDLHQRRAAFAGVLGSDLATTAKALLDAWDPASGDFYAQFAGAGTKGSVYTSDQEALNVVNTAMFYIDKQLKDDKLGIPAGLLVDCKTGTCPLSVESRYSQNSNANLVANLHAFRSLFQGCGGNYTGLGFDDWLAQVDRADLANSIITAISVAQAAAYALPAPLEQLVSTDVSQVISLHTDISSLDNTLKTQYLGIFNFMLPGNAIGDND